MRRIGRMLEQLKTADGELLLFGGPPGEFLLAHPQ